MADKTPAPAPAPTPGAQWYEGKVDAETLGFWQNKGYDLSAPEKLATALTEHYRSAEKHIGADPKQIIRLPKDPAKDPDGMRAVWQRLGAPKEAKDYDLSNVKFADGTAIDNSFADTIRQAAFSHSVPKDAATAFAQSVVNFMENADKTEAAEQQARWDRGVENIKKSWGPNTDLNHLMAKQGANRLGINQDQYDAIARAVGVDVAAEMFRKIGAGTEEHAFVDGKSTAPKTAEAAAARLDELQNDQAWAKRLLSGDSQALREFHTLTEQIAAAA